VLELAGLEDEVVLLVSGLEFATQGAVGVVAAQRPVAALLLALPGELEQLGVLLAPVAVVRELERRGAPSNGTWGGGSRRLRRLLGT
jgi:hypothetical protein